MTGRRYEILDVFTADPLAGNPLAIVHDTDGLTTEAMQKIAREFNLSETVFVAAPARPAHRAAIRIFTPNFEMPFAGHPTVGSAVALALADGLVEGGVDTRILVLEEKIGDVRCVAGLRDGVAYAEFDLPQLPRAMPLTADAGAVAAALGLDPQEIGFENHRLAGYEAGVPYVLVPVRDRAAAARARLDPRAWATLAPDRGNGVPASAYVYTSDVVGHDCRYHARMFTGGPQTYEDPATGSALAAFAGQVAACDAPADGAFGIWVEQGLEMGRPSRLRLELDMTAGAIAAARIGGFAVRIAEGRLFA